MESDVQLNTRFRFLALSEDQAENLNENILEAEFGVHHKTKNTTASVSLNENNIPHILAFIENNKVLKENTDIFISFVSEYDSQIIDIPSFVNQAIVRLDSKLVLSYTIV